MKSQPESLSESYKYFCSSDLEFCVKWQKWSCCCA